MSIYEYDEEQHMKWVKEEGFEEGIEQGIEQGISKGQEVFARLTKILLDTGKQDELLRAATDEVYRRELLKQYNLQ